MLENLNDVKYCSQRALKNNVEMFIYLEPTKESNKISFACVNLLLNNLRNVETLLLLKLEVLEKILHTIPSQMKTLLALDTFNSHLNKALEINPNAKAQYDLIKETDYSKKSLCLHNMIIPETLINPTQLSFAF